MRRSLGRFSNPTIGNATRQNMISPSWAFSTSSGGGGGGGGGGRGRGRGSSFPGAPDTQFTAPTAPGRTQPEAEDNDPKSDSSSPFPSGLGHGRGKPLPSTPTLPSFSSFVSAIRTSNTGTGRGRGAAPPPSQTQPHPKEPQHLGPKIPIFFSKGDEMTDSTAPKSQIADLDRKPQDSDLPSSVLSMLPGAGRGKPAKQPGLPEIAKEENRHLRPRRPSRGRDDGAVERSGTPRLTTEEAVRKAVGILNKGADGEVRAVEDGGGRGAFRGRGRGRGRFDRGRGRGRGRGRRGGMDQDADDSFGSGLYVGDDADGDKLAKKIGVENMNKLEEGLLETSAQILPSPVEDAYLEAVHTNFMIECEPEYLMEEFGTNPDIDERPPIPLRDALEKMKPFLMAYEGIQSQEEWEEFVNETMNRVPIMKELVDYYSGPDRVTAKKQQEELERVAKTLPESTPASVKRFTDHAVLSLQSNPGWGFDKKCQFMDKLVWEVSQHYR